MLRRLIAATSVLSAILAGCEARPPAGRAAPVRTDLLALIAARAGELGAAGSAGVEGRDGFFFLKSDLSHYAKGPFWGEDARGNAAEADKDPLEAILDFHAQLKGAGVRLVFMPVPGKVAVYPDKLFPGHEPTPRLDAAHCAFFDRLRADGVEVVDLTPDFLEMRSRGAHAHCRQDAHWTPEAMKLAAAKVAALARDDPSVAAMPRRKVETAQELVEFTGDIVRTMEALGGKSPGTVPEDVTVERVTLDGRPVESDPASPVLLIGDSHCIVYHAPVSGGIDAAGAGLFEHLAKELGFAPDLVANLGSGANPPRIALARRRDNLAGKSVVVWCLSARELTESAQGWRKIPVVR